MVHNGIVLHIPSGHRRHALVYDEQSGAIEAFVSHKYRRVMCHGALIQYRRNSWHHYFLLDHVNLIDIPLSGARVDIFFLQHVLELVAHFSPMCCVADSEVLFNLLKNIYSQELIFSDNDSQRLYLCALLRAMAVYPEEKYLLSLDDDSNVSMKVHKWISSCLRAHPEVYLLKTSGVLKKLGIHD